VRSFAFAKHSDHMTPDIEAFMQNPNPDTETAELQLIGWPSIEQLMRELSMPVYHYNNARKNAGLSTEENVHEQSPESASIRDKQIIPALRRYEDAHGLFDLGATEDERRQAIIEQVPGYAMVVQAMMHDDAARGLYPAMKKKANGEPLDAKDKAIMEKHPELVDAIEGMLSAAGNGYATAPCNQIYRAANLASDKWSKFIKEENQARMSLDNGSAFSAKANYEVAMESHREALKAYKHMYDGLAPVCEMIDGMIDSPGRAQISDKQFAVAKQLVEKLPDLGNDDKVRYNVSRIATAVERALTAKPGYKETLIEYATRSARINQYAETSRADSERLLKQIDELQATMEKSGGDIAIRDPKFRDVFMGMRALSDRLEMMAMSAEQLYVDMGKITGKQNAEWLARETEGERNMFKPPVNPDPKLVKVAEELQRNAQLQHSLANGHREAMLQLTKEIGDQVDRFDVIHDFFDRLRNKIGDQISTMEARQAKWDNAYPGTGAAKAV